MEKVPLVDGNIKDLVLGEARRETLSRLVDLHARYSAALDNDRLEDWPTFFTDDATYRITSKADAADDLPLGIIYCNSKKMMVDRITSTRQANIYEGHGYRHIISAPLILTASETDIVSETSFCVIRIMHTGDSMLFASGVYLDNIVLSEGDLKFSSKTVVLDSHKIDTLLAIPF